MSKKKQKSKQKPTQKKKSTPKGKAAPHFKWVILTIPIITFLLYFNTINHGYVLDDDLVCNKNKYVQAPGMSGMKDILTTSFHQGFTGTPDRHYRPMMMAAFSVEKTFFGNKPSTYHFFNIFWYAVSCMLLFLFLHQFFNHSDYFWLSVGITLLFICHPIHTEVVANIKSRDEIFVFLGLAGALYSLMKSQESSKMIWLIASLFFYFIACLSKESGLQIIALVPFTLYFSKREIEMEDILKTTAFYLLPVLLYFLLRNQYTGDNGQVLGIIDNSLYGAEDTITEKATAIMMAGKYLLLLIFPYPLSFDYSAYQIPLVGLTDWRVLLSIACWIGLIAFAAKEFKQKSPFSYGLVIFLVMFALVCNIFFLTGVTMAERLIFSPSLGFCMILAYIIYKYLYNNDKQTPYLIALGIVALIYSFLTISRNSVWASNDTLFQTGIYSAPNSSRTQSFFGKQIFDTALTEKDKGKQREMIDEALAYYNRSLEIHPGFTDVHHHKGVALEYIGQLDEAIVSYQNALATKPDYHLSICNIGLIQYNRGQYMEAIENIRQAHLISPGNEIIRNNYEIVLLKYRDVLRAKGDIDTAIFYDKEVKKLRGQPVN